MNIVDMYIFTASSIYWHDFRTFFFFSVNLLSLFHKHGGKICNPFAAFTSLVRLVRLSFFYINFRLKPKLKLFPEVPSGHGNVNRRGSKYSSFFFFIYLKSILYYTHIVMYQSNLQTRRLSRSTKSDFAEDRFFILPTARHGGDRPRSVAYVQSLLLSPKVTLRDIMQNPRR